MVDPMVYRPGEWLCDTCDFRLHKRILAMDVGDVLVDDRSVNEPCPNGCGDTLAPVTWKAEALEYEKKAEKLIDLFFAMEDEAGRAAATTHVYDFAVEAGLLPPPPSKDNSTTDGDNP